MNEINYGEVFGVETNVDNATTDETTEIVENTNVTDMPEPEIAESETEPVKDAPEQETPAEPEPSGNVPPEPVSPRRAAAEQAATAARARAEAQMEAEQTLNQVIAQAGLTNPYTHQPITSKAEYDAFRSQMEAEQRRNILEKTGMTEAEFQHYVQSLPEVRNARQQAAAAENYRRQAAEAQARWELNEQLKEIHALDPTIHTVEDLARMEDYDAFRARVSRGMTLGEAYKLTNYEKLTRAAAEGARQQAMNNLQSKSHLEPARSRGVRDAGVPVPADVRELYQALIPGATDAEIRAHYNRYRG